MKNRLLCLLFTLALCCVLPASALAAEEESTAGGTVSLAAEELGLPENEELFEGYLTQLFYPETAVSTFGTSGRARLNAAGKAYYDALKPELKKIAAGERTSTSITIDPRTLPNVKSYYTYEEVGFGNNPDAGLTAIKTDFLANIDLESLYTALLSDMPYEMYWHDKLAGIQLFYLPVSDSRGVTFLDLTFYFFISSPYAVEDFTVDPSRARSAATALDNAHAILAENSGKSDYQKLLAYADAICALTDYNIPAAENDGALYYTDCNPWQLIYVFDGDPSTQVVCEGYSKAFQYLCDNADFKNGTASYLVSGWMDGGAHMWNIVTYNGKNYLVDVTNSDAGRAPDFGKGFFLAGGTGTVSGGYNFYFRGEYILYQYDPDTLNLWDDAGILQLSSAGLSSVTSMVKSPSARNVTAGKTAKFTVTADGTDLAYQWQYRTSSAGSWKNSSAASAKKATLSVTAKAAYHGYQYRCLVTGADGVTITSSPATLTVFGIKTQPTAKTAAVGEKVQFTVNATGKDLTYQWQYKAPGGSWKYTTFSGAKTDTLTVTPKASHDGCQFLCRVTDSRGEKLYTEAVKLTVKDSALAITSSPKRQTVEVGEKASFTVKATGDGLTYQWYYRKNANGDWTKSSAASAKTATLSVTAKAYLDGYQYRCRVSDASGAYKYSSYATLVVKEPLAIISSPKRQTVEAGEKARFTVQATGEDLTYQWYYRKNANGDWTKSTAGSADEATLSVTAKNYLNGYQYRCKVTDGDGNYKYSSYATLVIE